MKTVTKFLTFLMLLAVLVLPVRSVYAQGPQPGGQVLFGTNYTLESGETLDGDLVVFGGNVTLETDTTVNGNIVVFGGTIASNGEISGDVVAIGGQINLEEKAIVAGDVVTVGGQLSRDPGAQVMGDVINNVPAPRIDFPKLPSPPDVPSPPSAPQPDFNFRFDPFTQAMGVFFRAVAVALLAMLMMVFLQPQVERAGQAIVTQPLVAGSFGLLAVFLAPLAVIIMAVTIILIPVALIGVLLLVLAWLFGVIAMGQEVGERFTRAINQTWAPVLTAGFGTFLLMLVGGSIGMIPCVGWVAPLVLGLMGIGGVVLTLFGSRPYPRLAVIPTPPSEPIPPAS